MKKKYCFSVVLFGVLAALILSIPAHADKFTNTIKVYKKSKAVQPFFKNAYGYAVFPTIGKAGIGIGNSYGKGQVYKGGKVTGEAFVIKGSIGFQLGVQVFSEMISSEDKRAYDEFTSGNFVFDITASVVAITAGAQEKAGSEGASAGASADPTTGK